VTEFEIVAELPPRQQQDRKSKYSEFWAFVENHPDSWVKWPYAVSKGTPNLAKHRGLKVAKRDSQVFFRKEAE